MGKVKSEYEIECIFIEQLESMGYQFISMTIYSDVLMNFRNQFCQVNKQALVLAKGKAELSDSEFDKDFPLNICL